MPAQFLDLWTAKYTSAWNDYNLSRHFPYTGQLTRAGMAARGTPVTDVIALDATVVAAIMAGTGPLTSDGVTVSSQDAADFFNRRVYELYPDSAEKDAVVVDLMQQMLDRLSSGAVDLPAMVRALAPAVGQGRLLAWSSRQDDQELLEGWPVGGVVPDAAQPGPWMSASFNNSAGNKLDAFVGAKIDYRAATCGRGLSSATITLTNDAPPAGSPYAFSRAYFDQGPPGTTRLWTAVYGPVGARFRSASIDGVRQYVHEGRERGHPVWLYNLTVPQGGTTTLTVSFTEPPSDNLPTVSPQPMAVPVVTTASATCG
jgi:hypothetical protein